MPEKKLHVRDLSEAQISAALEVFTHKPSDAATHEQIQKEFRESYGDFLRRFFTNDKVSEIESAMVKVSLLLPRPAIATTLSTGFIAGFNAALAALTPQEQGQ